MVIAVDPHRVDRLNARVLHRNNLGKVIAAIDQGLDDVEHLLVSDPRTELASIAFPPLDPVDVVFA